MFISKKRKIYIITALSMAALFIIYGLFSSGKNQDSTYDFVVAERKNIVSEVDVTGRVRPAANVDLAFERGGRVATILANVGDKVEAGQILLTLNSREIEAELSRVRANVDSVRAGLQQYEAIVAREEANLEALNRGARTEEIALSETRVASAEKALEDARANVDQTTNKVAIDLVSVYEGIKDVLRDAYAKADDAINRQADAIFINRTTNPQLSFNILNPQLKIEIEWQRNLITRELENLRSLLSKQSLSLVSLESDLESGRKNLLSIRDFLQQINEVIENSSSLSDTTINNYRTGITLGLNNVNSALAAANNQQQRIATQRVIGQNSITAAEARVNDAKSALAAAKAELKLKQAPASTEVLVAQKASLKQAQANLASQRARVREAQAAVSALESQLADNNLVAPFSGTVTKQEAKVGEIVAPGVTLVSIMSESKFETEANVPEVDISKIQVGNTAKITLDAYGNDVIFSALVVSIDPAETIIEGVSTYKVKLQFSQEDERIKSGMTANVTILAANKENVLVAPQRAIIDRDGKKIIRVMRKEKIEEVEIKSGLRGTDGNVEILEGISEGDKVAIPAATK